MGSDRAFSRQFRRPARHRQHVQQRYPRRDRIDGELEYSVNSDGTPRSRCSPVRTSTMPRADYANPHNYWTRSSRAMPEDDDADELALPATSEYDFDKGGWMDSLKVGVRYADRNQTVRYSTFNWTPIAASWNCNSPGFNADNTTAAPYPACNGNGTFKGLGQVVGAEGEELGDVADLIRGQRGAGNYHRTELVVHPHALLLLHFSAIGWRISRVPHSSFTCPTSGIMIFGCTSTPRPPPRQALPGWRAPASDYLRDHSSRGGSPAVPASGSARAAGARRRASWRRAPVVGFALRLRGGHLHQQVLERRAELVDVAGDRAG